MDLRWAGGDINRIRALARELIGLQADIVLTGSIPTTVALQRETRTIPIVFVITVVEPVASGIVAKLVMFSLGRCAERGVDCADPPPDVGRYLGHHHRCPFTGAMAVTFRGAAATGMDAGARGRSRPW
jgi:hypothetical protein